MSTTTTTTTTLDALLRVAQEEYKASPYGEAFKAAYKRLYDHPNSRRSGGYVTRPTRFPADPAARSQLRAELAALAAERGMGESLTVDGDYHGHACVVVETPRIHARGFLWVDVPKGRYPAIAAAIAFRGGDDDDVADDDNAPDDTSGMRCPPPGLIEAVMYGPRLRDILTTLADRAATALQPPGRAEATADTLRELAALNTADVPMSYDAAWRGLSALSGAATGDSPPITARRRTCGELAAMISADVETSEPRVPVAVFAAAWAAIADELRQGEPDARRTAIAATMAREAAEIAA